MMRSCGVGANSSPDITGPSAFLMRRRAAHPNPDAWFPSTRCRENVGGLCCRCGSHQR
jgi:hypothetical protein